VEILDAAQRRQDCNERPDPEADDFIRKREENRRGRALINVSMCQCVNVPMYQWGNEAMWRCVNGSTYLTADRCGDVAMGLVTGLWIIKNLHVGKYDAGE